MELLRVPRNFVNCLQSNAMAAPLTSSRINAYFYFLLVRLIELEAVGLNPVEQSLVYRHLHNVVEKKISLFPRTTKKLPSISNIVTNLRQNLFVTKEDLCFTSNTLKRFALCIDKVASYNSWSDFINHYAQDKGAKEAEKYRNENFFQLPSQLQYDVKIWASHRAMEVYSKYHHSENIPEEAIIFESSRSHIIRTAARSELSILFEHSSTKFLKSVAEMERIYDKNPNCFVIFTDGFYQIVGSIFLLPLTTQFAIKLTSDGEDIFEITENDVNVSSSRFQGGTLVCLNKIYIFPFCKSFRSMIEAAAGQAQSNKVFCLDEYHESAHLVENFRWNFVRTINDSYYDTKYAGVGFRLKLWEKYVAELIGILDPPY